MPSINGMAERLRNRLAEPGPIELPGCYDVLSALILEQVGFECIFLSGYGVAASLLGNPDIGLTSLTETALLTKNVTNRLHVPLIVDADNGYGNEDNVMRTVYELEFAGAAAMIMEDQIFPKRCGHADKKAVVPLPHYMKKLECALKARQTPMCVIARTDAQPLDEAITRVKAFHSAGADVVLIDGLQSMDEVKRVADEAPGPKQINLIYGGKTSIIPLKELAAYGYKIILYSTPALYVAAQAMVREMMKLRETHDLNSISDASVTFKEFQAMIEKVYMRKSAFSMGGQ